MGYGNVIKEARKRLGLTQNELRKKIGCARTTVCDWEKEKYAPTDGKNIAALESILGFSTGHLFSMIHGNPILPPSPEGGPKEKPRPIMKDRHKRKVVA